METAVVPAAGFADPVPIEADVLAMDLGQEKRRRLAGRDERREEREQDGGDEDRKVQEGA